MDWCIDGTAACAGRKLKSGIEGSAPALVSGQWILSDRFWVPVFLILVFLIPVFLIHAFLIHHQHLARRYCALSFLGIGASFRGMSVRQKNSEACSALPCTAVGSETQTASMLHNNALGQP